MATELDAMLTRAFDGEKSGAHQKIPSPDDQRDFIKVNLVKCGREDIINIFRAIVIDGQSTLIKKQIDNSIAVNLDRVQDETIKVMYLTMSVILDRNKSLIGI